MEKAKKEFEALLAAVWAQQVERLRTRPGPEGTVANNGESVKAKETGNEPWKAK